MIKDGAHKANLKKEHSALSKKKNEETALVYNTQMVMKAPRGGGVSAVKWSGMLENENSERTILCGRSSHLYPPFHTLLGDSKQFLCEWGY